MFYEIFYDILLTCLKYSFDYFIDVENTTVTVGVKYHVENETLLSMHCSQILLIVALVFQIRDRKDDYVEKARFQPY